MPGELRCATRALHTVQPRMPSQPTLCTSSDDGGLVVSLAMQAGVPIETLGTVLRQGARVAQGTGGRLVAASQAANFPAG